MRVAIDGYYASPIADQAGFRSYIRLVTQALVALSSDELLIYVPGNEGEALADVAASDHATIRRLPFNRSGFATRAEADSTWYEHVLAKGLRHDSPDVYFGTCFFGPSSWHGPSLVMVHDVLFEAFPQYYTPESRELYSRWGRASANRASRLLTSCDYNRDQIPAWWPEAASKQIDVCPLPSVLPTDSVSPAQSRETLTALGVPANHVLVVSPNHRRKNLEGVLDAYSRLPHATRRQHPLVILNAGHAVREVVSQRALPEQPVLLEHVPDDLVPQVYARAAALLFPSWAEGFGLPIVEAMHHGVPVITSDRTAMPSVAGDAGLFADPGDLRALSALLRRVLHDPALADSLRAAGLRRSRLFTRRRLAEQTRLSLEKAISDHQRPTTA